MNLMNYLLTTQNSKTHYQNYLNKIMNNELMEQYALIDAQIKALTNQKDELKVQIVQDFIAQGIELLLFWYYNKSFPFCEF